MQRNKCRKKTERLQESQEEIEHLLFARKSSLPWVINGSFIVRDVFVLWHRLLHTANRVAAKSSPSLRCERHNDCKLRYIFFIVKTGQTRFTAKRITRSSSRRRTSPLISFKHRQDSKWQEENLHRKQNTDTKSSFQSKDSNEGNYRTSDTWMKRPNNGQRVKEITRRTRNNIQAWQQISLCFAEIQLYYILLLFPCLLFMWVSLVIRCRFYFVLSLNSQHKGR